MVQLVVLVVVATALLFTDTAVAAGSEAAVITSIEPRYGSLEGGTRVTILGTGFARGGQAGSTTVFIGSTICKTEEYYSTDSQIVCYTQPHPAQTVSVEVQIITIDAADYATCSTACTFRFHLDQTPIIREMTQGAAPTTRVRFGGYLRAKYYEYLEVRINNKICTLTEDDDVELIDSPWHTGFVSCDLAEETMAGHQNVSFSVQTGERVSYGLQQNDESLYDVPINGGNPYIITVHPIVTSISQNTIGSLGGLTLTIEGHGFSDECEDNSVIASGVNCVITSCSFSEIQCELQPFEETSKMHYTSAGYNLRAWEGNPGWPFNGDNLGTPSLEVTHLEGGEGLRHSFPSYVSEAIGFFVPPLSGNYTFFMKADDTALFELSADENPKNLSTVTYVPYYSWHYFNYDSQISEPVFLEAGKKYFTQVHHRDTGGGDFFHIAALVQSEDHVQSELQQDYDSLSEVQALYFSTKVIREEYTYTFVGVRSGSFYFYGDNTISRKVSWDSSNSYIQAALRDTSGCNSIAVWRADSQTAQGQPQTIFTIQFRCPTDSSWPLPQVIETKDAALNKTSAYSLTTAHTVLPSDPIRGSFRLGYNNSWTDWMSWDTAVGTVAWQLTQYTDLEEVSAYQLGNIHDGRTIHFTIARPFGDVDLIQFDESRLEGTNATMMVNTLVNGSSSLFLDPLPGEYFQRYYADSNTAVVVTTNGIPSVCDDQVGFYNSSCAFSYDATITPIISSIDAPSEIDETSTITIHGSLFNGNASVTIGGAPCTVMSQSPSLIECGGLTGAVQGSYPVVLTITSQGQALDNSGTLVNVSTRVDNIFPAVGGVSGGALLQLQGYGFSENDTITFGDNNLPCVAVSTTPTLFTCVVPALPSTASIVYDKANSTVVTLAVNHNGLASGHTFDYDWAFSFNVDGSNYDVIPSAETTTLIFSGFFPEASSLVHPANNSECAPIGSPIQVLFDADRECVDASVNEAGDTVTCTLLRDDALEVAQQANQKPQIRFCTYFMGSALAHVDPSVSVDIAHRVSSIYSTQVGVGGNAVLSIEGSDFGSVLDAVGVRILAAEDHTTSIACRVFNVTHSKVECTTDASDFEIANGVLELQINGFVAKCGAGTNDCAMSVLSSLTANVTGVANNTGGHGTSLTIFGSKFLSPPVVTIGGKQCAVTSFTQSVIECTLPELTAGSYDIAVNCAPYGDAVHFNPPTGKTAFQFNYMLTVSSLSAHSGSPAGGLEITLSGDGFNVESIASNYFYFSAYTSKAVFIVSATYSELTLVVPSLVNQFPSSPVASTFTLYVANGDHFSAPYSSRTSNDCSSVSNCTFSFDGTNAPTITSVSPSSGVAGTTITLKGINLLNADSVLIGGSPCDINSTSQSSDTIECSTGNVPGGDHVVYVNVPDVGVARGAKTFSSVLDVTSISPIISSHGGGTLITLHGTGFGTGTGHTNGGATVKVCNDVCNVVSSAYGETICATPSVNTPTSHAAFNDVEPQILMGTPSDYRLFDDDLVSYATSCSVVLDLGEDKLASVTRVRFFPRLKLQVYAAGSTFSVSSDGENYTQIAEVGSNPTDGWTSIIIENGGSDYSRYIRYDGPEGGPCSMGELEYHGLYVNNIQNNICPVQVGVFEVHHPSQGALAASASEVASPAITLTPSSIGIEYRVDATPYITSVSPRFGSSLGGTRITLAGTTFPVNPSVMVNGYECTVQTSSSNEIQCITTARSALHNLTLVVTDDDSGSNSVSEHSTRFRYLDRWSLRNTWLNDEPPVKGDTVVIPEDQVVLMDVSPPKLFLLLVYGELVFDRQDGLELHAEYIWVNGGLLEIGTEEEPFENTATITMYGDRWNSVGLPHIGAKCVAVSNFGGSSHSHGDGYLVPDSSVGRMEIHGKPRIRTWTKVASNVDAGSDRIYLSEKVDFANGETIVLTDQVTRFHIEELVVEGLEDNGYTIVLQSPTQYSHNSGIHTIAGEVVDMRIEVGLISRNIVIQGEPGKSEKQVFGSHLIAVHGAELRLENVEIRRCGQSGMLGRYCSHFHIAGDLRTSYIRSNSIHHSFQRAVTVHATHRSVVKNNVAYYVKGHTFFVEDGNEMFNEIDSNLGIYTRILSIMLKSDQKPATFWMKTPTNLWKNNVATGSEKDGFWLEASSHPGGPSFTTSLCPVHDHWHEFRNNTAHGNGVHGLRVYPSYFPLVDPCDPESAPAPQYLYNFTSFMNGGNGIFCKKVGDLHHVNAKLVANGQEELLWRVFKDIEYRENDPNVVNSLFVNSLDAPAPGTPGSSIPALFMPQNEFYHVSGATFVNYGDTGAIAGCAACNSDTDFKQGGYTYRLEGLRFIQSARRTMWTIPNKQIFQDLDGSLTGYAGGTATPFWKWNVYPGTCDVQGSTYDDGIVCDSTVQVRRLQIDGVNPEELDFQPLHFTQLMNTNNNGSMGFRVKESYGWVAPVVNLRSYYTSFDSAIDFRTMRIRYSEPEYLQYGEEFMELIWKYTDYRYAFDVTYANGEARPAVSVVNNLNVTDPFGTGKIVPNRNLWHVILTTSGIDDSIAWETYENGPYVASVEAIQCAPGSCNDLFSDEPLYDPTFWSDISLWCRDPSTGTASYANWGNNFPECDYVQAYPQQGDDVVIYGRMYCVMDVNPPVLNHIQIVGKLEFHDNQNRLLEAFGIEVWGILAVGSAGRPFSHEGVIRMHGNRNSPTIIVHNSRFLGNKVVAVLGELQLHGNKPDVAWTRITATIEAGDSAFSLVEAALDWAVGDQLVISGTEYDADEYETVTIASISSDGRNITTSTAFQHRHYSGVTATAQGDVELRAVVGKLNRNVRFEGAVGSTAEGGDAYGAHIVVMDAAFDEGTRVGSSHISGVELNNCGQEGLEHACILYVYDGSYAESDHPTNILEKSSMPNSHNYAIVSEGSAGIQLEDNVFHDTQRSGIKLDENTKYASIIRTAIVGNRRTPDAPTDWAQPFAAIFADTYSVHLEGNVVSGCADAGYTIRANDCGTSSPSIFNNEVHSALVGVFIIPDRYQSCAELKSFKAWKIAHIAIAGVDERGDVELSDVVVSDSHIGISVTFFNPAIHTQLSIDSSVIMGSTAASTCSASITCRAVTSADVGGTGSICHSVMGSGFRHVGLLLPQFNNRGKTCGQDYLPVCRPINLPERMCSMGWDNEYGLPGTQHGVLKVSNTDFAYFGSGPNDDCGKTSVGITVNPSQRNYSPEQFYSGISWTNSTGGGKFWFDLIDGVTSSDCTNGCDSLLSLIAHDQDGSFAGGVSGDVIVSAANPGVADGISRCTDLGSSGAIRCTSFPLGAATIENIDRDRGSRILGPVKIQRLDDSLAVEREHYSVGPFDDGCAKRFFFGQYPFTVESGRVYNLNLSATFPSNTRVRYYSQNPNDKVLLRLYVFLDSQALRVVHKGSEVPPLDRKPTLADGVGANALVTSENLLYLVVQGSTNPNDMIYDIRTVNKLQVNLTFSLSLSDFSRSREILVDNLAILLNIPASRIKVVSVHAVNVQQRASEAPMIEDAGTVLDFSNLNRRRAAEDGVEVAIEIADATNGTIPKTDEEADMQLNDLNNVVMKLATVANNGTLKAVLADVGLPLESVVVVPAAGNGADKSFSLAVTPAPSSSSSSSTWGIAGACVGVALLVALVLFIVYKKKKDAHEQQQRKKSLLGEENGLEMGILNMEGTKDSKQEPELRVEPIGDAFDEDRENNVDGALIAPQKSKRKSSIVEKIFGLKNKRPSKADSVASDGLPTIELGVDGDDQTGENGRLGYKVSVADRVREFQDKKCNVITRRTWEYVSLHDWYHPQLGTNSAEKVLDGSAMGSFLIYGRKYCFLCVNTGKGGVEHFAIEELRVDAKGNEIQPEDDMELDENNMAKFRLITKKSKKKNQKLFDDLASLVEYYQHTDKKTSGAPFQLASSQDNSVNFNVPLRESQTTTQSYGLDKPSYKNSDLRRLSKNISDRLKEEEEVDGSNMVTSLDDELVDMDALSTASRTVSIRTRDSVHQFQPLLLDDVDKQQKIRVNYEMVVN